MNKNPGVVELNCLCTSFYYPHDSQNDFVELNLIPDEELLAARNMSERYNKTQELLHLNIELNHMYCILV